MISTEFRRVRSISDWHWAREYVHGCMTQRAAGDIDGSYAKLHAFTTEKERDNYVEFNAKNFNAPGEVHDMKWTDACWEQGTVSRAVSSYHHQCDWLCRQAISHEYDHRNEWRRGVDPQDLLVFHH